MAGVLEGIRVLDFGRYIAGPYCAALLAEHGADVIRIEKREGSEDRFQAPVAETGEGALFLQMNRNKRGLTLDPMTPDGREVVRRLVATADVVVANLPPQTLLAMQLDYESLTAVKPDIILTTVTAYGRGGPYSERVGFDGIGQVMSGAVYMTGTEEQPYRAQVPWVDFGTALHCAFGTMAALMARKATGEGQWVEGALLATAVTMTNAHADRAGRHQAGSGAHRQPWPDLGPGRHLPHQGRVDPRAGDRPAAVQALGQADGRGALAHRPALQGRHLARRQRRRRQRAHGPLVRRAHHCGGAGDPGQGADPRGPGAQAAADAGRPAHQRDGVLPAGGVPRRAPAGAGGQGSGAAVGDARLDPPPRARCSASTPRRSWRRWATTRRRLPPCATRA